jgi:hypothetical protein
VQTLKPGGRLGLVLHPDRDPTPIVQKLTRWARAHGKRLIVDARDAARVPADVEPVSEAQLVGPERYQRRSGAKLSLLDLPFLPEEMRDVLPGGDRVTVTLGA